MGVCNAHYLPVLNMGPSVRYIDVWGGRGRGGSYFVTEYFLDCLLLPAYFRGYFMRAVYKDVRESLWQDFKDRIDERVERGQLDPSIIHLQDTTMTAINTRNGNMIRSKGFRKSDKKQTAKLKSIAGATHVAIEECEEIEEEEFDQLDISLRTTKAINRIFRVFNPPKKNHWLLKSYYNLTESKQAGYYVATPKSIPGFLSVFSRYYDNIANISESAAAKYEAFRLTKPEYYWTTIRGLVSEGAKGRIFSGWQPITAAMYEELPYPEFHGIDFGYSNDPATLASYKKHNDRLYVRPKLYKSGLTDAQLAGAMQLLGVKLSDSIYADSAEPKAIATLKALGFINIIGVGKGPDSIRHGIKQVQGLTVYYVEGDTDFEYEYQEYRWHLDANKEPTDTAEDKNNHYMDNVRYAVAGNSGKVIHRPSTASRPRAPQSLF